MSRDRLRDPALRRALVSMVASEAECLDLRAAAAASCLDRLPAGSCVALYGCGGLAARLVEEHGPSLTRHRTLFAATHPDAPDFRGHPLLPAAELPMMEPDLVLLLSQAFEGSMLAALARFDRERIRTLNETVESCCPDAALARVLAQVEAEADELADELRSALPAGRPSVCVAATGCSFHLLDSLRHIRRAGYGVALLLPREGAPGNDPALDGGVDFLHLAASADRLHLALARMSEGQPPVSLWYVWSTFRNTHALARMAAASQAREAEGAGGAPLVVALDAFLPPLLEEREFAGRMAGVLGVTPEGLLDQWTRVFTRADGLVYKDAPELMEECRRTYGRTGSSLYHLPCLKDVRAKTSRGDGPLRLVFAHSLHRTSLRADLFDFDRFLETVEVLTGQGIRFTVYNNLDAGGGDYRDLQALARRNPLFDYRLRVPFDQLVREMAEFDFGWLHFGPDLPRRFPGSLRANLQMKIFAYAQAGLPTLVDPELVHCRRVVAEHGIGLDVPWEELPRLGERLRGFDHDAFRRSLARLGRELDVDRHTGRLVRYFDHVRETRLAQEHA